MGRLVIPVPHPLPSSPPPTRIILSDEMPLNDITQSCDLHTHVVWAARARAYRRCSWSRFADSVLNLHYMDLSILYWPTGLNILNTFFFSFILNKIPLHADGARSLLSNTGKLYNRLQFKSKVIWVIRIIKKKSKSDFLIFNLYNRISSDILLTDAKSRLELYTREFVRKWIVKWNRQSDVYGIASNW